MMRWIGMAYRNILRNKRRSFVTLLAIAVGFASVSLFYGYTDNTYNGIRNSAISGEGLGHLTLFKKGWHEFGRLQPEKYLLGRDEVTRISELVEAQDGVLLSTPQLHISGLVANGTHSTIFLAVGVEPDADRKIKGDYALFRPVNGKSLQADRPYAVEMAQDLASQLELKPKSDGIIMASTLDGQMNALNIEVAGTYDTGTQATNDKFIRLPFAYAQELYDTQKADRVIVLLEDWRQTEIYRQRLQTLLAQNGLQVEIKSWNERSQFYTKVKRLFDMIFTFIFAIVLIIVVMSVTNTMGMAVIERTREIGTLRALGLKRRGVSLLFALEGAMMGGLGCLVGTGFTVAVWALIQMAAPTYTPPSSSSPVPLVVNLLPEALLMLTALLMVLSLLAAILPARRAARRNVVDALGHV